MHKLYYVYIMTNKTNSVLYTGITNNLSRRTHEHRKKLVKGFTSKYNLNKLVYYEVFESPAPAIEREKQLKAGSRLKKVKLIETMNSDWKDLSEEI